MIYVDEPMWQPKPGISNNRSGGGWCHMISDTGIDELNEFAAKLGLKPEWLQRPESHPHYDLSLGKRKLAIKYGAVEIKAKQVVEIMKAMYPHIIAQAST